MARVTDVPGQSIYLENHLGQQFNQRVTGVSIADVRYDSISTQITEPTLVLVTCYPFPVRTGGP